jgi:hypothetical protein
MVTTKFIRVVTGSGKETTGSGSFASNYPYALRYQVPVDAWCVVIHSDFSIRVYILGYYM